MKFESIYGVDFSGAKEAGRNIWIARLIPSRRGLRLRELSCLEDLCSDSSREKSLGHLVSMIQQSRDALWGIDFPFGLPIEVMDEGFAWRDQLKCVADWKSQANEFGRWCVERAKSLGGKMHIRRTTDIDTKTPFDCYHYRIIYQTFHGMRDVLLPLADRDGTVVMPFDCDRLGRARRVVVEACPGSTLKRLGLPHQNYKQPTGGALTTKHRNTRKKILDGIREFVEIDESHLRTIMRNPGGDALDAVIAGVGVMQAWNVADLSAISAHSRYPREGFIYA